MYDFTSDDLQDLGEIGRGAFGTVNKMVHRKSNTVMAVKVCQIFFSSSIFGIIFSPGILTRNLTQNGENKRLKGYAS